MRYKKFLIPGMGAVVLIAGAFIAINQFSKQGGEENLSPIAAPQGISNNTRERKFVALGASISKANNLSSSLKGDHQGYSFTTGDKIESIYAYLKNKGKNLIAVNLAESGADSAKVLQTQVPNAVGYNPQYVTIDATGDILNDAAPDRLTRNLAEIIAKMKSNGAIILVGSYPDFTKLRSAPYPSCKKDILGAGFDKLTREKVLIFNQAIKKTVDDNGVIFVDIYDVLEPEDVSDYDCIHPNINGQKKLAQRWIDAMENGR